MAKRSRKRRSSAPLGPPPAPPPAPPRPRWLAAALFAGGLALVAAYLRLKYPALADADELYHFRHAALYLERGPFFRDFPWTAFSVISVERADLWYGFHLLLAPFALVPEPVFALKLAGIALFVGAGLLAYRVCRRHGLWLPLLWPALLMLGTEDQLWRWSMTRPHVVSTLLLLLLLSLLVRGKRWQIPAAAAVIAWLHLSVFWVALLVTGTVLLARGLWQREWAWRDGGAVLGGLLLGWLLRPGALGAAQLLHVQVVGVAQERLRGTDLGFGRELFPPPGWAATDASLYFFGLWALAAALFVAAAFRRRLDLSPELRVVAFSSLALSLFFGGMFLFMSWRAVDFWIVFAALFLGAAATAAAGRLTPETRRRAATVALTLAVVFGSWSIRVVENYYDTIGRYPYAGQPLGRWLRENSGPGEIVFHAQWDLFPDLFFWNTENRYVGGMDPIFQYAYSRPLFWKARWLAVDLMGDFTTGTPPDRRPLPEETCLVLRRDFDARYLVVAPELQPRLHAYVEEHPCFTRVAADAAEALLLYRIARDEEPTPGPPSP